MWRTTRTGAMAGMLIAAALAGCGSGTRSSDDQRPPAAIVLTASISDQRVSISPHSFGAGPISLVVTNQTKAAQRLTLESADAAGRGPGLRQETAPISPRDTALLKADVEPGRYTVHVVDDGIAAAALRVGPQRASAQNDLLQP
jgi:hypothetical protein